MACKYSKLEQVGDNRYEVEEEEAPDKNKDPDDKTVEKDEKSVGVKILVRKDFLLSSQELLNHLGLLETRAFSKCFLILPIIPCRTQRRNS